MLRRIETWFYSRVWNNVRRVVDRFLTSVMNPPLFMSWLAEHLKPGQITLSCNWLSLIRQVTFHTSENFETSNILGMANWGPMGSYVMGWAGSEEIGFMIDNQNCVSEVIIPELFALSMTWDQAWVDVLDDWMWYDKVNPNCLSQVLSNHLEDACQQKRLDRTWFGRNLS